MTRIVQNSEPISSGKDWSYDELDHEIQKDAVNCGVFIIDFIQKFVEYRYKYTFDATKAKPQLVRKVIYDRLVKNFT